MNFPVKYEFTSAVCKTPPIMKNQESNELKLFILFKECFLNSIIKTFYMKWTKHRYFQESSDSPFLLTLYLSRVSVCICYLETKSQKLSHVICIKSTIHPIRGIITFETSIDKPLSMILPPFLVFNRDYFQIFFIRFTTYLCNQIFLIWF